MLIYVMKFLSEMEVYQDQKEEGEGRRLALEDPLERRFWKVLYP